MITVFGIDGFTSERALDACDLVQIEPHVCAPVKSRIGAKDFDRGPELFVSRIFDRLSFSSKLTRKKVEKKAGLVF